MPDPYLDWLGIPEHLRPPTHYQLLGIPPSELDRDAIAAAADRQLERLRPHESGPQADECRRIAAEIATARSTLLDPVERLRYDTLAPDAAEPWWKPEGGAPVPTISPETGEEWWKGENADAPRVVGPPPETTNPGATPAAAPKEWWQEPAPTDVIVPPPPPPAVLPEPQPPPLTGWWKGAAPEPPPAPVVPPPLLEPLPAPPPAPVQVTPVPPAAPAPSSQSFAGLESPRARGRGSSVPWALVGLFAFAGIGTGVVFFMKQQRNADPPKEVVENPRKKELTEPEEKSVGPNNTEGQKKVDPEPKKVGRDPIEGEPETKKVEPESKKVEPEPAEDFKQARTFRGHEGSVLGVAVTRDAKSVLSVSDDKVVLAHSVGNGTRGVLHKLPAEGVAVALCNQDQTAVFCDGFLIVIFDMRTQKRVHTFENPRGGVQCLAAPADGSFVLTGSSDGSARLWSVAGRKLAQTFDLDETAPVTTVAVAPNGRSAAFGLADGRVCGWDLQKARELKRWKAHAGRVTSLAVSPDGQRVVSGGEDGLVQVWQSATGKLVQKMSGHKGPVLGAGWCSDGQRVVTAGVDRQVCLWDTGNGRKADWSPPVAERVFSLAVDAKDRFVIAGLAGGTLQLLPLPQKGTPAPERRERVSSDS